MFNILKATRKDYKELYSLNKEWFDEKISPKTIDWSENQFFRQLDRSTTYVAKDKDGIIGFIMMKSRIAKEDDAMHNVIKGEKYIDLDSMFVKRKFRNKGVGTKLLKHAIKEVKRVGYKRIILSADSKKMNKLVKFYEKQGFETLFVRLMLETRK